MKLDQEELSEYESLAESITVRRPAAAVGPSYSSSPAIQTSPAQAPTPPSPNLSLDPADLDTIWADSASEHSDDWERIADDVSTVQNSVPILCPRAMAEDFSEGRLETLVSNPQKELAGTQNAYVSYLVSTKVHETHARNAAATLHDNCILIARLVRLPVLPKARLLRPSPLHRLRLPMETALQGISAMRRPSAPRQAQDGVCSWRPVWPGLHPTARTLSTSLPQAVSAAPRLATSHASDHLP